MFYRGNKNMGTRSSAYEFNHECASTSDLITHTRTSNYILLYAKTRVQMFYYDSYTTKRL